MTVAVAVADAPVAAVAVSTSKQQHPQQQQQQQFQQQSRSKATHNKTTMTKHPKQSIKYYVNYYVDCSVGVFCCCDCGCVVVDMFCC
jgi:hypothetical protein